jgi:putative hydrolase of the HAD superfamily
VTYSKIRGVFFDAGNTLLRVHPSIGEIYSDSAAEFGIHATPEQIEKSFQDHWKNTLPLVSNEGHRITYEKERDWWRYVVREVFQQFVEFNDFDAFFNSLYARFARSDSWRLYEDVPGVLDHLKKADKKLAIVSNWDSRLPALCDQLGIASYFNAVVVSSLVGYEKPHPAIFQIALESTGLSPQEVLYIGDDPFLDYQAARKADLHALHLDRDGRFPAHQEKISSLHELIDRIS